MAPDERLCKQLIAELDEAQGQLNQARNLLQEQVYNRRFEHDSHSAWLAWHKCQEAETNLHNVAVALEKGAGKQ